MTDAIVRTNGDSIEKASLTQDQVGLLKRTLCAQLTDDELSLFVTSARRYGLDPFLGQIHAVKRSGASGPRLVIQVGIHGFRALAERSGQYDGMDPWEWWDEEATRWVQLWLKDTPPPAARATVYRKDNNGRPFRYVALYKDYVQRRRNDGQPNAQWALRPEHMLAKCAESNALRMAFPQILSGLYSEEEMGHTGNPERQLTRHRPSLDELRAEVVEPDPDAGEVLDAEPEPAAAPEPDFLDDDASEPVFKFGRLKGQPFTSAKDDELKWYGHALSQSIADPARAQYRDNNEQHLAEVRAEWRKRMARREVA